MKEWIKFLKCVFFHPNSTIRDCSICFPSGASQVPIVSDWEIVDNLVLDKGHTRVTSFEKFETEQDAKNFLINAGLDGPDGYEVRRVQSKHY